MDNEILHWILVEATNVPINIRERAYQCYKRGQPIKQDRVGIWIVGYKNRAEIADLVRKNKRIPAIKRLREITRCCLIEAKSALDTEWPKNRQY